MRSSSDMRDITWHTGDHSSRVSRRCSLHGKGWHNDPALDRWNPYCFLCISGCPACNGCDGVIRFRKRCQRIFSLVPLPCLIDCPRGGGTCSDRNCNLSTCLASCDTMIALPALKAWKPDCHFWITDWSNSPIDCHGTCSSATDGRSTCCAAI